MVEKFRLKPYSFFLDVRYSLKKVNRRNKLTVSYKFKPLPFGKGLKFYEGFGAHPRKCLSPLWRGERQSGGETCRRGSVRAPPYSEASGGA